MLQAITKLYQTELHQKPIAQQTPLTLDLTVELATQQHPQIETTTEQPTHTAQTATLLIRQAQQVAVVPLIAELHQAETPLFHRVLRLVDPI